MPQRQTFVAKIHSQKFSAYFFKQEDTTFNIRAPKLLEGKTKHRTLLYRGNSPSPIFLLVMVTIKINNGQGWVDS